MIYSQNPSVAGGMSAPQVFGTWAVLDQFRRSYLSLLCIHQGAENIHVQGRWKVFDNVLSYFNFSLEIFLILPLNRVYPRTRT